VDTNIVRRGRAVDPAQREAEAAFLAARAVPVAEVAERCLRGVQRNQLRILVGCDYRLIDAAVRAAPALSHAAVTRLSRRMRF
jgi:hypothetical protein